MRMLILSGNVDIGTDSPGTKLLKYQEKTAN